MIELDLPVALGRTIVKVPGRVLNLDAPNEPITDLSLNRFDQYRGLFASCSNRYAVSGAKGMVPFANNVRQLGHDSSLFTGALNASRSSINSMCSHRDLRECRWKYSVIDSLINAGRGEP